MKFVNRISLSWAPFLASLVVVTSLTVFIGIFWAFNEYQAYEESLENIRYNYQHQYEVRLQEELDKVVEDIEYRRARSERQVEQELRQRVQVAYTIASHKYQLYKDVMSPEQLRTQITDLLRPMRWNTGQGYYFTGRVTDNIIDLFADEPMFEGMSGDEFGVINGRDILGDINRIVRDREAGLYRYNLVKPAFGNRSFSKVVFVKYFAPLDWFIGAAIYNNDLEERLQNEVLERLNEISFGKDGEVFCLRSDGTVIANHSERLIGRSAEDLVDAKGFMYGKTFMDYGLGRQANAPSGANAGGAGLVHYAIGKNGGDDIHQKLGYVRGYPRWNWILGTAMFMDAMEQAIDDATKTYRRIAFKNVFTFIVLFAVAVGFLLISTFFYSLQIRKGFQLFTNFFRQAADSNVRIKTSDFLFREFDDLGQLANSMVEIRVKNEQLLHRDELRLDTLLRLGMMGKHSLQEKYDFILSRIIQITRSEQGYLGLVNTNQSHLTLCSWQIGSKGEGIYGAELELPRAVELAGLPGRAVSTRMAIIENEPDWTNDEQGSYPYGEGVRRYMDVPVFHDGRIVVVAGVCNNDDSYDKGDVRQMTMVLEGLWMHVLKKCSEEELVRLERQVIAVSEEERSNIGRDLHDGLGSHLTGVELLSKALQQRLEKEHVEFADQLGTIRNLIRESIEKTRRLSQGLYPVHVVEYGLESAIEELVSEVENMFRVGFDLSWQGEAEKLDQNTATHLYYIIREAVFNGARHGKPQKIGIYMKLDGHRFSVSIVDDGEGFDMRPAARGMGFHTMQYRAKAIGAELSIASTREGGTTVTVTGEVQG